MLEQPKGPEGTLVHRQVVRTYLRDAALLTDVVRSTIVLEDMTQVWSHHTPSPTVKRSCLSTC